MLIEFMLPFGTFPGNLPPVKVHVLWLTESRFVVKIYSEKSPFMSWEYVRAYMQRNGLFEELGRGSERNEIDHEFAGDGFTAYLVNLT
jgi:hypothetical protein